MYYVSPSPPSSMKQCNKSAIVKFHMEVLLTLRPRNNPAVVRHHISARNAFSISRVLQQSNLSALYGSVICTSATNTPIHRSLDCNGLTDFLYKDFLTNCSTTLLCCVYMLPILLGRIEQMCTNFRDNGDIYGVKSRGSYSCQANQKSI